MFTPPSSPLPSPGKEKDPMDAAGAALLGANLRDQVNSERVEKEAEKSEIVEEWRERHSNKKRTARLRTITATMIIPAITLTFFFFRINPFFWSPTPDVPVVLNTDENDSALHPPVHQFNPHVPHSPLNHIPRRDHDYIEKRASVSTASSLSNSATVLQTASASNTESSPTATLPPVTGQAIPTVPSTPPNLPTPFPQPFDSDFGQNFSAQSCYDFLMNMTNTQPFRTCRPFGMLVTGSDSFSDASLSLETLNSIMWGTCNTNTPYPECIDNVNWFSTTIQSACSKELSDRNPRVVSVLGALQSYPLYRRVGCLVDPGSNTYCYLNAVHNSNPSDVYLYNIGLGKRFPTGGKANPTCSACSRQVINVYSDALGNGTGIDKALLGDMAQTNLQNALPPAVQTWRDSCGSSFATATISGGARIFPQALSLSLVVAIVTFLVLGS
ncbi:hypothetical protein AAF712_011126 [Marasmius tenuissimus]|uniref:DUF7729 domain-containing protein n=1 Tax=Marasmius tenuissimus TaxID=585030 RepID=A0ABR2ZKZ4_9AGAR